MAKRGRPPGTGKKENIDKKGYFYEREEQAVVDYLNSNDIAERNQIYNTILKPAFEKMVESIIHRYKLYVPEEEYDETFNDTLSFLLSKLNCFSPERNYKAYSYCGTICKNYLIYRINNYKKEQKRLIPLDYNNEQFTEIKYEDSSEKVSFLTLLLKKTSNKIKDMLNGGTKDSLNENEIKIGNALVLLLDNWDDILSTNGSAKLNKSAVLFFLREQTNLNTKELRDNMKKFKLEYFTTKNKLLS